MAKKESTFLNMVLTMLIITAVAAVALAYVNKITKEPIEIAREQKLKAAINIVVPGAEKGEIKIDTITSIDEVGDLVFYTITIDKEIAGTAVRSITKKAFGGEMIVMVGFDKDGKIIDSNVLQHKETPGLGDKTDKKVHNWNNQFMGKNPADFNLQVRKDGGDVDAITAATISSRAYIDAIQRAYDTFMANKDKINAEEVEVSNNENNVSNQNNGGTNNE